MTNDVKTSEALFWAKVQKKCCAPSHNCYWAGNCAICSDVRRFSAVAHPERIAALLETLEKTRACLAEAERVMVTVDPNDSDNWKVYAKVIDRARSLLSGFSGDASKEERGG